METRKKSGRFFRSILTLFSYLLFTLSGIYSGFADSAQVKDFQGGLLTAETVSQHREPAFRSSSDENRKAMVKMRKKLIGEVDTAAQKNKAQLEELSGKLPRAIEEAAAVTSQFGQKFEFSKKQFETLCRHLQKLLQDENLNPKVKESSSGFLQEMERYGEGLAEERLEYLKKVMLYPDYLKQNIQLLKEHQASLEQMRDFSIYRKDDPLELQQTFRVVLDEVRFPEKPELEAPLNPLTHLKENIQKLQALNRKLHARLHPAAHR